jgi:type IV pilus biogenesis protein CpaD/CtpE
MRCPRKSVTAVGAIIVVVSAAGCATGEETGSTPTPTHATKPKPEPTAEDESGKSKPVEPTEPTATASQENALRSAESYLGYEHFSKSGLEEQLTFESYSSADAQYAANNVGADWNEQAVGSAEAYLEYESFSETGLVEQLEFEGYAPSQAQYGASKAYH